MGSKTACIRPASMREKSKKSVYQLQQPHAIAVCHFQLVGGGRRQFLVAVREQLFNWSQHERKRCAELVADIAEEGGLGAVDLGERFGAFFSSSYSRALAMAVAICEATRFRKS